MFCRRFLIPLAVHSHLMTHCSTNKAVSNRTLFSKKIMFSVNEFCACLCKIWLNFVVAYSLICVFVWSMEIRFVFFEFRWIKSRENILVSIVKVILFSHLPWWYFSGKETIQCFKNYLWNSFSYRIEGWFLISNKSEFNLSEPDQFFL